MTTYLPLSGLVAITSGDAQDESIIFGQLFWGNNRVIGFRRSVHLGEDLLRKSFGNPSHEQLNEDAILKIK